MESLFLSECRQWLEQYGYSLHVSSQSNAGEMYVFTNISQLYYPSITCNLNSKNEKSCSLSSGMFKMCTVLSVSKIQFKHPDIEKYISVFNHYSELLYLNPPF